MEKLTLNYTYTQNSGVNKYAILNDGILVASVFNTVENPEKIAKLISAAPELLEACLEFVRKVECGQAKSTKSYNQMKLAIKKATE